MFLLFPFALVVIGALIVVLLVLRTRSRARSEQFIDHSLEVDAVVRGLRFRMTIAFGVFFVVAVLLTVVPQPANWTGLGHVLGVSIAAILGCLVVSVAPLPAWPSAGSVRTAELVPRGSGSFGPPWGFTLPLASAGILVVFLVVTALASSRDELGIWRAISGAFGAESISGSPNPAWFYVVPIIAATAVLAVAVMIALRRIALAPRPASSYLFEADDAARRTLTRFVMLLSSSALLLYFGTFAVVAGVFTSTSTTVRTNLPDWSISSDSLGPDADQLPLYLQSAFIFGRIGTVLGIGLVLLGLGLLVAAIVTVAVRWAPAREPVDA
ncbi:hypothetical protein EYE40_08190 [Glaciihabitans arcticus]|uniref:Uncharacterized protein n=1 Tax=Glaciihabitans arcticus TaxID=2668039 RepID=A0A4V2JEY6_9MICO|nr:hypothetical protein [Glaciihabitans arcticus]TBN57379.1 hypothetical protein EYE40_08190 [Glaciihabitans arcticus]